MLWKISSFAVHITPIFRGKHIPLRYRQSERRTGKIEETIFAFLNVGIAMTNKQEVKNFISEI